MQAAHAPGLQDAGLMHRHCIALFDPKEGRSSLHLSSRASNLAVSNHKPLLGRDALHGIQNEELMHGAVAEPHLNVKEAGAARTSAAVPAMQP